MANKYPPENSPNTAFPITIGCKFAAYVIQFAYGMRDFIARKRLDFQAPLWRHTAQKHAHKPFEGLCRTAG